MATVVNVKKVRLKNFTKHERTWLDFPSSGVVLVTGPNGSGKSSVVEGVSYAGWGEMLRGTTPGDDTTAIAEVGDGADGVYVERTRKKGSTKLSWSKESVEPEEFPTTSKAQSALESVIGSWEVWRRTHVFSSTDAAHFTLATDKERKLFLETLLGLGRFDEALAKCRNALNAAERALDAYSNDARMCLMQIGNQRKRLADATATVNALGPEGPSAAVSTKELDALNEKRAGVQAHITRGEREAQELNRSIAAASGDLGGMQWQLKELTKRAAARSKGICDACGQPLPDTLGKKLEKEAAELRAKVAAAEEAAETASADFRAELVDTEGVLKALRKRVADLTAEMEVIYRRTNEQRRVHQARIAAETAQSEAGRDLTVAEKRAAELHVDLARVTHEQKVLLGAEQALGLKGARAGILTRLLTGLEDAANAWLGRIAGPGLKLELKPYSEKKSGGVSDAISLQVHGAGGGLGYKAASGGERRRVDVALLLAFAGQGTLFFDEVFDALDADGVHAVCDVLKELAADRCVVVISHSEEIVSRLQAAQHWKVDNGSIQTGR